MNKVFYSNIIVKEIKIKHADNLYRVDKASEATKLCEVLGVGTGHYDPATNKQIELPFKVGDRLVVANHGWLPVDAEEAEGQFRIENNTVIKLVEETLETE